MPEILDIRTGKPSSGQEISPELQKDLIDMANQRKTFYASKYPNYKCKCGCELFTMANVIKKVPGADIGELTNDDTPVPLAQYPVWVCVKCGEVAPFIQDDEESMKIVNKLLMKNETTK